MEEKDEAGVVEETEEELQARLERESEEEAAQLEVKSQVSKENCSRVQFTPAHPKDVVSSHSSSILAKEGPVVPLTAALEAAARAAFAAVAAPLPPTTPSSSAAAGKEEEEQAAAAVLAILDTSTTVLADLLIRCEATPFNQEEQLVYLHRSVEALLQKNRMSPESHLTESQFLDFVSQFVNPPYYYGERMRKLAGRGCLDDVLDVLARGCSVNTADGEGTTCLHYAAEFNRIEMIQTLAEVFKSSLLLNARDKAGWTPLYNAVHFGNIDSVKELLARGAAVNDCANNVGKTPLHCAAGQGRLEIAMLLMDNGADANVQDNSGMTACHEAAYRGHSNVYDYLLSNQPTVDVTLRDNLNMTAGDYFVNEQDSLPAPPTSSHK